MTTGRGPSRGWFLILLLPLLWVVAAAAGGLVAVVLTVLALQLLLVLRRPPAAGGSRRPGARPSPPAVGAWLRVVATRVVPAAIGCLVLLVAVDWGVGALWDRVTGSGTDGQVATQGLAGADLPPAEDPRVDVDAMADAPWADRYFAEMEALDWTYVPFVGPREAPVHGRYINSADGVRRSYEPPGADGDEAVTVWFFGGSTLWGEGQRDLHTIPSEVARLAEADGVTLRVVNFGTRGYSAFQELLVLEQELARRDPPDLAVFYHGFNELSTQTEAPENLSEQPTIFQLEVTADAFDRVPALPRAAAPGEPSVMRDYVDTSAVHQLWRAAGSVVAVDPAGADEPFYVPPPEEMATAVDNAEAIYRRTMGLVVHVASAHDVTPVVFWQPSGPWVPYDELGRRVAGVAGGIDISDALDDPPAPVYIDGVHTNELGAQLSAAAIWRHLAPTVDGRPRR